MPELGLLKSLLDEVGIACEIRNEASYPNFPGAAFQPEIWVVEEKDYAKACEIRDASQFSPSAGTSALTSESPKEIRRNRIWFGLVGLLMVVFAVAAAFGYASSGDPVRVLFAFLFGPLGALFVWLSLFGWRNAGVER